MSGTHILLPFYSAISWCDFDVIFNVAALAPGIMSHGFI